MKSERTWLRIGASIATFASIAVGILIVAVLRYQFLQNFLDTQTSFARKSISTSLEEFRQILDQESKRPFTEYSQSNFGGVSTQSFLRFSNISAVEPSVRIPGLVGFFQITEKKKLELPFYPEGLASDRKDRERRRDLARRIYGSIYKTQPINSDDGTRDRYQRIFKGIWLPNFDVAEIVTPKSVPTKSLSVKMLKSGSPIEKIEDLRPQSQSLSSNSQALPMQTFVLESGYLVFYRTVLHNSKLLTQGFVVDQKTFFLSLFKELIDDTKRTSEIAAQLTLLVEGRALGFFPSPTADAVPLFQTNELSPLEGFTLLVSSSPGRLSLIQILALGSVVLTVLIILGAILLLYRTAIRQLELSERQAAFVSSVSHELRTPITAIRMHGELLKAGWADNQARRESSYDYILKESERLSRLIENVLRYARIGRDSDPLSLEKVSSLELKFLMEKKIFPIIYQSGFQLELQDQIPSDSSNGVEIDPDALTQILINIVDNAIKFSRTSEQKKISISLKENETFIEIKVRDFGPGIPEESRSKVFDLFFRAENEMT
ncbi:MAG: HAMP domain-containing histidine kinase [Deltaproteobacteria bacterium]|nr:HAMP domain-containing histidine kinase [Deltaproteobacteria bacterium]